VQKVLTAGALPETKKNLLQSLHQIFLYRSIEKGINKYIIKKAIAIAMAFFLLAI